MHQNAIRLIGFFSLFLSLILDLTLVVALAILLSVTNGAPQIRRHRRHWDNFKDDPYNINSIQWSSCGTSINSENGTVGDHKNRSVSKFFLLIIKH